jgi:nitrate/nitrite-specific signal transduction histidine kinase
MSNQNNLKDSEEEKSKKSPFQKTWNEFFDSIKDNFNQFQKSLEKKTQENQELWNENKEKATIFFKDLKENWDKKVKSWSADIEKKTLETKEQWNTYKSKVEEDVKNWQDKTHKNWSEGLKTFRRGFLKTYLWALLLIIPILIIIIVVLALVTKFLA